jgi:hypothetical protein
MQYSLSCFSRISPTARKILKDNGIKNTDALLERLALPSQRERFSHETGLSEGDLEKWTGLADLVRIKGIEPKTAEVFIFSGLVGNIQQFIEHLLPKEQSHEKTGLEVIKVQLKQVVNKIIGDAKNKNLSQSDQQRSEIREIRSIWRRIADQGAVLEQARELHQKLKRTKLPRALLSAIPQQRELAEMVEEAVELRPRVVLIENPQKITFREEIKNRYLHSFKPSIRFNLGLCGVLTIVLLFSFISIIVIYRQNLELSQSANYWDRMVDSMRLAGFPAMSLSAVTLVFVGVIISFISLTLFTILNNLSGYYSTIGLMTNTIHQAFYLKVEGSKYKEDDKRLLRTALIVTLVIYILVALYLTHALMASDEPVIIEILEKIKLPTTIGGVMLGLIVSSFSMIRVLRQMPIEWEREEESFRRYFVHLLLSALRAPILGFFALYIIIISIPQTYNFIDSRYLSPNYDQTLADICYKEALREVNGDKSKSAYEESLSVCLNFLKPGFTSSFMKIFDPDEDLWKAVQPILIWAFSTIFIGAYMTTILVWFVIPYLWLGGWKRGIFYFLLLIASSLIEDKIKENFIPWLDLKTSSLATSVFIWFIILSIALLLDWIYDSTTNKKILCPACQTLIDDCDFCPFCGFVQTQ